jgi:hypothetical protein
MEITLTQGNLGTKHYLTLWPQDGKQLTRQELQSATEYKLEVWRYVRLKQPLNADTSDVLLYPYDSNKFHYYTAGDEIVLNDEIATVNKVQASEERIKLNTRVNPVAHKKNEIIVHKIHTTINMVEYDSQLRRVILTHLAELNIPPDSYRFTIIVTVDPTRISTCNESYRDKDFILKMLPSVIGPIP